MIRLVTIILLLTGAVEHRQQPATWRLVEEWRVGGAVTGPHSFGDVRGMGILPDGRIVLVDNKDKQVHFLDTRGQPIRTVGRRGAGPGEFERANGLAVSPRGEVIINDPSNNRLTLLSSTGELLRTVPIPNPWGFGFMWDAFYDGRGLLNEYVPVRKSEEATTVEARRVWSADLSRIDTILPPVCPNLPQLDPADRFYSFRSERGGRTMTIPYAAPRATMVRTPDGARWEGRHPDYHTIVRIPAGRCQPDVTVRLEGARVTIPAVLRDSAIREVRASAAQYGNPVPDLSKIPREYPAFEALFGDPSGRLWVERRIDGNARRFEVYGGSGALVATISAPVIFQAYRPLIITNDRIVGFVADEDELLYLASFRIVRGS